MIEGVENGGRSSEGRFGKMMASNKETWKKIMGAENILINKKKHDY